MPTDVVAEVALDLEYRAHPDWLTVVQLPAPAPDLNPIEGACSSMKVGLGNLSAATMDQLAAAVRAAGSASSAIPPSSPRSLARPASHSNPSHPSHRTPAFNPCSKRENASSAPIRGFGTTQAKADTMIKGTLGAL